MNRALIVLVILAAMPVCLLGQPNSTQQDANKPATEMKLAARSLYASTLSLLTRSDQPRLAGLRAAVLSEMGVRLDPSHWDLSRMHADSTARQRRYEEAVAAMRRLAEAKPRDHEMFMAWVSLQAGGLQDAPTRLTFLQEVARRQDITPAIRAELLAWQAEVASRQGQPERSSELLDEALKADPLNIRALSGKLMMDPNMPVSERTGYLAGILKASPMSANNAWNLSFLASDAGLHKQALALSNYSWEITRRRTGTPPDGSKLIALYAGSMLDANANEQAVEFLQSQLEEYKPMYLQQDPGESLDLRMLLLEACRQAGKDEKAAVLDETLDREFLRVSGSSRVPLGEARDAIWYYLVMHSDPNKAEPFVNHVKQLLGNKPLATTARGMLELARGNRDEGIKLLRSAGEESPWASYLLAAEYLKQTNFRDASPAVAGAVDKGRRGRAYRHMARAAKEAGFKLPNPPGYREIAEEINELVETHLPIWLRPEKVLKIQAELRTDHVFPGEPIVMDVSMENTGDIDIPLGAAGLLSAVVTVTARIEDANGIVRDFPMYPIAAPRYLKPGGKIAKRVRLDVGDLDRILATTALDSVKITFTVLPDPVARQDGEKIEVFTPMTTLDLPELTVSRRSLFAQYPKVTLDRSDADAAAKAYRLMIAYLRRDYVRGELPVRMRAVRQVAMLATLARQITEGDREAPAFLKGVVDEGYPLAMVREIVAREKSPIVRAELLAAMEYCPLDRRSLKLIEPLSKDQADLVRLRMVSLLIGSDYRKRKAHLRDFEDDTAEIVRRLAVRALEAGVD